MTVPPPQSVAPSEFHTRSASAKRGGIMTRIYNTHMHTPEPLAVSGAKRYKVSLNAPVMKRRLAKKIYGDETASVRELASNAITSVEKAIKMSIISRDEALVTIRLTKDRKIIIEDNGTGITQDVFKKILAVMGNSGNFDGTLVGQFGMGFYAFCTASESALIETMTQNGESFAARCIGTDRFEILEKCERTTRGTTITLDTSGRNVDFDKLAITAAKIALVSRVPIYLDCWNVNCGIQNMPDINGAHFDASGIKKLIEHPIGMDYGLEYFKIDHRDFELVCYVGDYEADNTGLVWLAGIPLSKAKLNFNGFINIKSERKYRPAPNRSILIPEHMQKLNKILDSSIKKTIKSWGITDHESLMMSPMRGLFLKMCLRSKWARYIDRRVLNLLRKSLFNGGSDLASIYKSDISPGMTVSFSKNNDKCMDAAIANDLKIHILTPYHLDDGNAASVARMWGIPTTKKVLDDLKINIDKVLANDLKRIKCHVNESGYNTVPVSWMIDDGVVMLNDASIAWLVKLMKKTSGTTAFIGRNDDLVHDKRFIPYDTWIAGLLDRKVRTNSGIMKVREFAGKAFKIMSTEYDGSLLEKSAITIVMSGLSHTEAALASRELGRQELPKNTDFPTEISRLYSVKGVDPKLLQGMEEIMSGLSGKQARLVMAFASVNNELASNDIKRIVSKIKAEPKSKTGRMLHIADCIAEYFDSMEDPIRIACSYTNFPQGGLDSHTEAILRINMARIKGLGDIKITPSGVLSARFSATSKSGSANLDDTWLPNGTKAAFTEVSAIVDGALHLKGEIHITES